MPVEIKELIIRVSVGDDARAEGRSAPGAGEKKGSQGRALSKGELDRIVNLCTERVLKAIKKSRER